MWIKVNIAMMWTLKLFHNSPLKVKFPMPNVNETKRGTICWNFYKWPFLQNGPSCIINKTHNHSLLCVLPTPAAKTPREPVSCWQLWSYMDQMRKNWHKATTNRQLGLPQNIVALLLNRPAVLFKLFWYRHQLRNLRHFFAPQLQGSLLLASSIGNL